MTASNPTPTSRTTRRRWIAVFALLGLVAVLAATQDLQGLLTDTLSWIRGLGIVGMALFVLVYVVASLLLIPATFLTLGAGATFGAALGFPLVWLSATAAAISAFVVGRYAARGWIQSRVAKDARLIALDEAVGKAGWKIVLLSRLSPLFPFTILNYAFGLTRIALLHYALATWIGLFPGVLLYVYAGTVLGDLAGLRPAAAQRSMLDWVFYGVGLAATAAVSLYVARLARRALSQPLARSSDHGQSTSEDRASVN